MTILGDHEAAHFVRQSVAVMQLFSKKSGYFCKNNSNLEIIGPLVITAILDVTCAVRALYQFQ